MCTDLTAVPGEKFIVNRTRVISCLSSLWLQYKCILLRDKGGKKLQTFLLAHSSGQMGNVQTMKDDFLSVERKALRRIVLKGSLFSINSQMFTFQ